MTDVAEPAPAERSVEAAGTQEQSAPAVDAPSPFPLVLHLPDNLSMDEEQFLALCAQNDDLRFERSAEGDLIIMPPAGEDTPIKNAELNYQLTHWTKQDGTGRSFDSSSGFTLPNGAIRGPDAAWVLRERLAALAPEQRKPFPHLCPDFVIELRSTSDRLPTLRAKMQEYLKNGVRLGWLIDPVQRRVYIYRPDQPVERLDNPTTVSGEAVLPGFVLDVQAVFAASY
jgi:Uma2 family endonuclease